MKVTRIGSRPDQVSRPTRALPGPDWLGRPRPARTAATFLVVFALGALIAATTMVDPLMAAAEPCALDSTGYGTVAVYPPLQLPQVLNAVLKPLSGPCPPANPLLATSSFVRGETFDDHPSIIAFQDSSDDSGHRGLATVAQVGAVYGLAYDAARDELYAAAYHKRNSRFGPGGPGAVYAINLGEGIRQLTTVPNAGGDQHDSSDNYEPDDGGRGWPSKTSLGDIEIWEDGSELLVMNMRDRNIYRVGLPDGQILGNFGHGASGEGWSGDARPFAMGVNDGWLFHGVVNSKQGQDREESVSGYIYASRNDGADMQRVAEISLEYDRGPHEDWGPWPDNDDIDRWERRYPHPVITDITFDDAQNMIVGVRDRYADTGPSTTETYRVATGDILRLPKTGDMQWSFDPGYEHFTGDDLPPWHTEISQGGLAKELTRNVVVSTGIDPFRTIEGEEDQSNGALSAGAIWFDNTSGDDIGREELIYNVDRHDGPYGKSMAMGDIEVLCGVQEQPSPTPTGGDWTSTPETPQPSQTPRDGETPQPSETPTAPETPVPGDTPTATNTLPPGVTPSATPDTPTTPDQPKDQDQPTPAPTPELPKLPKTGGGGPGTAATWLGLILVIVLAVWGRARIVSAEARN